MHKRIDHVFAGFDKPAFYFFRQVVCGKERHFGGNDYVQIYMQVGTHVTRTESVNANDIRAGESNIL